MELDVYGERLVKQIMAQEAKEAQVTAAEAEFNRLNRRSLFPSVLKGQSHEKVGELRVWGISLGPG
jgi:hypothetical protein